MRTSISLKDDMYDKLWFQARVLEISLSKHISNILSTFLTEGEDEIIKVLKKLELD